MLHVIRRPRAAFTLIELLVVVAIIALLISILLPSLSRAREQAREVKCRTQIQQLMKAALLYTMDFHGRLPGTGINDVSFRAWYNNGRRFDYLTWFGTWEVSIPYETRNNYISFQRAPQNGRLWKYYENPKLLICPSARKKDLKLSYSTPENVSMAARDPDKQRSGVPPKVDSVADPTVAIQFLDEDEDFGIASYSVDDGFGENDMFADRHLGRAAVAFFDGHADSHKFARAFKADGTQDDLYCFTAWKLQIAPYNCRVTFPPWEWKGIYKNMPKWKRGKNYPPDVAGPRPPGYE